MPTPAPVDPGSDGRRWIRSISWIAIGLACSTAILLLVAMLLYPGGNEFNSDRNGFGWYNYWCDLTHPKTRNGVPNPGLIYGQLAMFAFGLGFLATSIAVALEIHPQARIRAWIVSVLGFGCALGTIAVALTPFDLHPKWHAVAVLLAGPMGFAAAVLIILGTPLKRWVSTPGRWAGYAVILTGGAGLIQYTRQVAFRTGLSPILPIVQKLAASSLIIWILFISFQLLARHRRISSR